jgi:hypothetical protein
MQRGQHVIDGKWPKDARRFLRPPPLGHGKFWMHGLWEPNTEKVSLLDPPTGDARWTGVWPSHRAFITDVARRLSGWHAPCRHRPARVFTGLFSSMSCRRGPKLWLISRYNSLTRVDLQLCFLLRRILALDRIHVREGWNVPWYLGTRY